MTLDMDDIKVVGANLVCMVILNIEKINEELQAIVFICTITYTFIRIINEIKKFMYGKASSAGKDDSQA